MTVTIELDNAGGKALVNIGPGLWALQDPEHGQVRPLSAPECKFVNGAFLAGARRSREHLEACRKLASAQAEEVVKLQRDASAKCGAIDDLMRSVREAREERDRLRDALASTRKWSGIWTLILEAIRLRRRL